MTLEKIKTLFFLHMMIMVYSLSGVCSKIAASVPFLSVQFCFYYGMIIVLLAFYAIVWQQIIKRISLTTAFANKAVTVVWGIIWGVIFFHESITIGKILGTAFVFIGVVIYSYADREKDNDKI